MKKTRLALLHSVIALLLCCSMLIGTTFAWFTDEVVSGNNIIRAGNLDVELEYLDDNGKWTSVEGETEVFDPNAHWEPGYTEVVYLRVRNLGNLALKYQLGVNISGEKGSVNVNGQQFMLSDYIYFGAVNLNIASEAEFVPYATREEARGAISAATKISNGYTQPGSMTKDAADQYVALVVYMPEETGNDANHMTGVDAPKIELGINLVATQQTAESDSFGDGYDKDALFPKQDLNVFVSSPVAVVNGEVADALMLSNKTSGVSAAIPAGVALENGAGDMTLEINTMAQTGTNLILGDADQMQSLNVHMEGVAADNTVPMLITLENYMATGLNSGALKLYHVEDGATVTMTHVADPANHNEFSYDPATGDVTLAMATFSEVAVVADTNNTWNGTAAEKFSEGDGSEEKPYLIANADQLAYFRNQVDGGNSFEGKYIKLENNIYLSNVNFDPIGWGYVNTEWNRGGIDGNVFQGTFDGNNKIIFDLYQNGWDLKNIDGEAYTYTNCGFGLFAAASNATFKDLTIYGASVTVECVEAGVLVGLSQNSCTYENISIHNSKIANYQRPAGGLIGEVSGTGTTTITNVTIGSDVVVGSLWGDFDAPCGGVIGARWDDQGKNPQIVMTNVEVGARMDVYSDVTSAYQWYAYRRAGMLIGNTELTDTNNKHLAAAPFLKCLKDDDGNNTVKVYYGDWAAYHYSQFTNQDNDWCNNYPWVRVEAGENCSAYSNPRYGVPVVNGVKVSDMDAETLADTRTGYEEIRFNQLYGGGQGVYGQPVHEGVEVINYRYSITYVNDSQVLAIKYVTETGAVKTENAAAQDLVEKWATENIKDYAWEFGGWMNAGSTKLTSIDKDNTANVVLYPYFNKPYTASFVDQNGNVLAWCLFFEDEPAELEKARAVAEKLMTYPSEDFKLDYWMVNIDDGVKYADADFSKYEQDVTIYPVFKYNGDVQLIPVDTDNDGATNYYQVGGFGTRGQVTLVEIPGNVLGIPVTEINANAFSSYDDLHSVRIPASIKKINYQSFSADDPDKSGTQRDTVTMYYEGNPDVWNSAMNDYNNRVFKDDSLLTSGWDNCMGSGSRVFFLDENGKVDEDAGYWELIDNKTWRYHPHAYTEDGIENCTEYDVKEHYDSKWTLFNGYVFDSDKYTNYSGTCDCGCGLRPDKDYWN